MASILPPDLILLWCPIGNALNTATNGLVDQSTGYPILEPYQNTGTHYTNEVGVTIQLNTGIDLTNATNTQIQVLQPNGSTATWTATVVALDRVNSVLQYVTQAGDLYYPGTYTVQPSAQFDNWVGLGQSSSFTIYNPFSVSGS